MKLPPGCVVLHNCLVVLVKVPARPSVLLEMYVSITVSSLISLWNDMEVTLNCCVLVNISASDD